MKIEESRNEKVIIDRKRLEQLEEFENNVEKILIKKSSIQNWTLHIENVEYLGKDEVVLMLINKLNEANKSIIELNERIKNVNYRKELIRSEFEKTTLKERISFLNKNTLKDWFIDKLEKYVYSLL